MPKAKQPEKSKIKEIVDRIPHIVSSILKDPYKPRKGWAKEFKKVHENGDDKLLIDDVFEDEVI